MDQPILRFISMFGASTIGLAILGAACDPQANSTAPAETAPPAASAEAAPPTEAAPPAAPVEAKAAARTAEAHLTAAAGTTVTGTVELAETEGGLAVKGTITGLRPGTHGFHIHETGDCSAADFGSAGSHWNPTAQPHGGPGAPQHHLGDLGNIEAGPDGVAEVNVTLPGLSLEQGASTSALGHAVIVHQDPDDLSSQPAGAAGARVACGVIATANADIGAP